MSRPSPSVRSRSLRRIASWLTCALLVVIVGLWVWTPIRQVFAQNDALDAVIEVLFQDLVPSAADDANNDGEVTVADIVAVVAPAVPTPTATPVFTPTPIGLLYAGVVSDLVPHAVGDQLVYRVTDPLNVVTTETTTATNSDPSGGFVIDDLEVDAHNNVIKHETQSYTDTGTQLFFDGFTDQVTNVTTDCHHPLLRLMMPLIAGQTFSTSDPSCTSVPNCVTCDLLFNGQDIGFVDRSDTFTPIEIVSTMTVAAGTFTNVIHISGTTQVVGTGGPETDEIYFAVGVGPILDVATTNGTDFTRRELVSGTIGNVPVGQ